jgi:O-antigen ligase
MIFTAITGADMQNSFIEIRKVISVLFLSYVLSCLGTRKVNIQWLYIVYIVLYAGILWYASTHIIVDIQHERLQDENINANAFAYYTFLFTFSWFELGEIIEKEKLKKLFRILFLGVVPLSAYVALLTASRQILVIQIPLLILLFYFRYYKKKAGKGFLIIVLILFAILYVKYVPKLYNGSKLQFRNEKRISQDSRMDLMKDAVEVGEEHPIFGVGPRNFMLFTPYGKFSHCSYTELFANSGILALLLYVYLLLSFMLKQIRRYRRTKDNQYLYFISFGLVYILANLFYVYYVVPWLLGYFFLVNSHSNSRYKEWLAKKNNYGQDIIC